MVINQAVYNWRVPMFPEASSDSDITDKTQFPNIIRVNAPLSKLGKGAVAVMKVGIWYLFFIHVERNRITCNSVVP